MKSKYRVIQNGVRLLDNEPVYQVATTIDGEEVVVVTDLMTKKEAQEAMKALAPEKKPARKKAPAKKAAKR
jgi:hypothetical protein